MLLRINHCLALPFCIIYWFICCLTTLCSSRSFSALLPLSTSFFLSFSYSLSALFALSLYLSPSLSLSLSFLCRGAVLKALNTLPEDESRAIHERLGLGQCSLSSSSHLPLSENRQHITYQPSYLDFISFYFIVFFHLF